MEKVHQALEKARREREAALHAAGGTPPRRDPEPPEAPPAGTINGAPASLGYSRTRVLPISPSRLRRQRIVASGGRGPAVDAFRMLRTRVAMALDARQARSIAVTAARQGEGKTLVAANLAISLARQQHRSALLVDLDLRRPHVAGYFGLPRDVGLSDHLEGRAALEDCLVNPGIERLVILPQHKAVVDSSELLASRRMEALAAELEQRYPDRIVVYDCPPLLLTDDALVALRYAETCLLVAREGATTRAELARAAALVEEDRLLGTVLNDARWSLSSSYYYDYGHHVPESAG
jgi:capsular exopolysaccharide synthesis family protein